MAKERHARARVCFPACNHAAAAAASLPAADATSVRLKTRQRIVEWMQTLRVRGFILVLLGTSAAAPIPAADNPRPATPARGPLRVHPDNPRSFTDGTGKAIYLTGLPDGKETTVNLGGGTQSFAVEWIKLEAGKTRPIGPFFKWQRIEIALTGPTSKGQGEPNPFSLAVDITFTAPSGRHYEVPGFYDGDGQGGLDGNVWKARFSADETGEWTFASTSTNALLAAHRGTFSVTVPAKDAPGFYRWGRLEAVGTAQNGIRYLKFRDGPYWLKTGCDDPENFLGRFRHYATPARRKAAVDYLAARGINSLYVMTHNIDGDHNDVWPWLGRTAEEAKSNGGMEARFDIAKLEEWRELFEHMQTRGVVPYLILEDDSAWKGYDHKRYYREMVARFGYLPALLFNIGEENNENYPLAKGLALARLLEQLDPFNHPRGIHNVNEPNDSYVDAAQVDFTAIQTGNPAGRTGRELALRHNRMAVDWIDRCQARGRRVLMVGFDEGRPELNRVAWWNAYLGGAVWEAHVLSPYDRPLSAWEPVWTELGGARAFMESLPFWEMASANDLVKTGTAFGLAKPDEVYAFYVPAGGPVTIELPSEHRFAAAWWNPANGRSGTFQNESLLLGGRRELIPPGPGDWAVRLGRR